MSANNPYWYKLIKLLKSKGIIKTGLTIPYLFGAYKALGEPFQDVNHLLTTILNSSIDKYPIIQKCSEIHHHVVMVEEKASCNKNYAHFVKFDNAAKNNLLYISDNTDLGKSIDKVCWNLSSIYEKPIRDEEYSWSNKEKRWKEFDESELELIRSIK